MGYLLHLLLALGTLAAADAGYVLSPRWGGAAVLPLALVPIALGAVVQRLLLQGRFRVALVGERALAHSPVVLQALALLALDWRGALERWLSLSVSLEGWPGPELLAGLAPFVLYELVAIDARARLGESRSVEVRRVRGFQVRLFLSAILPIVVFVALSSAIRSSERLRAYLEEVALLNALLTVLLLGFFVTVLPELLRRTWDTVPVERGGLRDMLEELARSARFRCRDLLVWRTANQMANAAIVGFTPQSRIVLFSDALLAQLRPNEVAAVFAHEIGHARRHHAAAFAAFAVLAFLGLDLAFTWIDLSSEGVAVGLFAAGMLAWYLAFGYLSRRFELEADLESVELLGEAGALADALHAVVGAHAHERSSWRHFSTAKRVRFLAAVQADPGLGQRLRRGLAAWRIVIVLLLIAAVAGELFTLTRSWGADRVRAHLRLGEYESAARLLPALQGDERELAALVERGRGVERGARTAPALEELARESLSRGDARAAAVELRLALLRGADARLGEVLQALLEEDPHSALRALEQELDHEWAAAVEGFLQRPHAWTSS